MRSRARREPGDASLREVVEVVVADGYRPDHIEASAGVPLRIIFRRLEDHPCSDHVVFSSPRLERRLAPMSTTIVDLPAQPGREIRFTCGMGRYRGRIDLITPTTPGGASRAAPALAGWPALVAFLAAVAFTASGGLTVERLAVVLAAGVAPAVAVYVGQRALARTTRS